MWVTGGSGVVEPFLCPQALVDSSTRLWIRLGMHSFPTSSPQAQGRLSTANPQGTHMTHATYLGVVSPYRGALCWDQQVHRATAQTKEGPPQ